MKVVSREHKSMNHVKRKDATNNLPSARSGSICRSPAAVRMVEKKGGDLSP